MTKTKFDAIIVLINVLFVKVFQKFLMNGNFYDNAHSRSDQREALIALLERARGGDQDSFSSLRDMYAPLLESRVIKHTVPDMTVQDLEDMRQEALIVFCNAVYNFRYSEDGVEFGLYAKICIDNALASFIRSYLRRSRNNAVSIDRVSAPMGAGVSVDPLQALVEKENATELIRSIKNNLSEYENNVWWLYVSGLSVSEIARTLKVDDPKSVSNAIYRIRKKLRTQLTDRA